MRLSPTGSAIGQHLQCNRATLAMQSGNTCDAIGQYLRCNRAILAMQSGNTCNAIGQHLQCNRAILTMQSGNTCNAIGQHLRCNRATLAMQSGNTCNAIGQHLQNTHSTHSPKRSFTEQPNHKADRSTDEQSAFFYSPSCLVHPSGTFAGVISNEDLGAIAVFLFVQGRCR